MKPEESASERRLATCQQIILAKGFEARCGLVEVAASALVAADVDLRQAEIRV